MNKIEMVLERTPINISHDTYRRECRYTRGIHIPEQDFNDIVNRMSPDTKAYFDFHNVAKKIERGTYFNGHSGLARHIANYYKTEKDVEIVGINDGRDFYVKVL
ncbi:hypothetical protein [Lysinibacillus sp. 54212]|uniref:hypothetical protein n=1 Tax=Lysinibacillus sp. 54212 TaxID=3119829 RepID=UPI002FCAFF9C